MVKQTCNKCNVEKDMSDFYIRKDNNNNHRKDCKECMSKNKKILREKNIVENIEKLKEIDRTDIKTCSICNEEKELNQFSICKGSKTGFYSWCLKCCKIRYKEQNKTIIKYNDTYIKCCNKCTKNKLVLENYRKKHSIDGYSNICMECEREYRKNNSKIKYQKKKEKLDTDLQFKMAENIRARIRTLFKTEKLIGCTLEKLIKHLQSQFYDDISLDNYGKVWHLDHIIPCNWFDLTDIKQINACCHYTNLQPLLIRDNLIKTNKLDWIHPQTGYKITFLRLVHCSYLKIK